MKNALIKAWRKLTGNWWDVVAFDLATGGGWGLKHRRTGAEILRGMGVTRELAVRAAKSLNTPLP